EQDFTSSNEWPNCGEAYNFTSSNEWPNCGEAYNKAPTYRSLAQTLSKPDPLEAPVMIVPHTAKAQADAAKQTNLSLPFLKSVALL
ncbi:MAG: hypothetical protein ABI432_16265, partial [Flavobacteriales bacterium]